MKRFEWIWISLWLAGASLAVTAGEIHDAASAGDLPKVQELIKDHPEWVNLRELGTTPLHQAARNGHLKVVEFLVSKGANPGTKDSSGLTPLRLAMGYGKTDVAAYLREKEASIPETAVTPVPPTPPVTPHSSTNLTPRPNPGVPAIVPEIRRPDAQIAVQTPKTNSSQPTAPQKISPVLFPIHDAAEVGDVDHIKALLKDWPELMVSQDEKGLTPLHVAAANGKKSVVEVFLARGARTETKTRYGMTPLHYAARKGNADTIRLLLDYGAEVNAKTPTDLTPAHLAAREGHLDAVRLLLERKADPNARELNYGSTPLHYAATNGNPTLIELLLAKGAEINARDAMGETALSIAVAANNSAVAEILRKHGGEDPINKPLSAMEQSLIDYYRAVDQTFRTGSNAEKKKAIQNMVPSKADVQKLFPRHSAQAVKFVEQLEQEVKAALSAELKDSSKEPPLGKLQPRPASSTVKDYQARGWLAADVPIYTLVVNRKGGKILSDAYCFVNNRWVPLPPLERIFKE